MPHGAEHLVEEERPLAVAGYLVAEQLVLCRDPVIQGRFIDGLRVRRDGHEVSATLHAYASGQHGMLVQLAEPLPGAAPLRFGATRDDAVLLPRPVENDGTRALQLQPFGLPLQVDMAGAQEHVSEPLSLAVAADGRVAGVLMNGHYPAEGDWPGDPGAWPQLDEAAHAAMRTALQERAVPALPLVDLHFRSPRKSEQRNQRWGGNQRRFEPRVTTRGVQVSPTRVLVLTLLDAEQTGRLERIVIRSGEQRHEAAFVGSLRDWAALLVECPEPLPSAPLALAADADLHAQLGELLPSIELSLHGEDASWRAWHTRVTEIRRGIHDALRPYVEEIESDLFIFTEPGSLLALPVLRRQDSNSYRAPSPQTVAARDFVAILADPQAHIDPAIAPLAAEEESRLAWIGVELQPMNQELGRANQVSEQTRNGSIGALVSYVYPGSPAEQSALQVGDVLIRLHVEGEPRPIPVEPGNTTMPYFPWDRLDNLPEHWFDRLPSPWPRRTNDFTRTLTDLGIDRAFVIEYTRGGESKQLSLHVKEGPDHFDSAASHKDETLGLTVRDLTYEVRRYFQKQPDEPGLIIAKVEPGGLAAVAGVRPFELVTHVGGKPLRTVADFEKLVLESGKQLRLHMQRLQKRRIVKIALP